MDRLEGVNFVAQVTARISDEHDAALTRWAADVGQQRSELVREILTDATDARREGRATFSRPELPSPADLQHLIAEVRTMVTELDRVLRHHGKRDAELAKSAKTDSIGISEARTEIVAQLTSEFHRTFDTTRIGLDKIAASLIAALTASPALAEIMSALQRIEREPRFDTIDQRQLEHGKKLEAHTAAIASWVKRPWTQVFYSLCNEHWSGWTLAGIFATMWGGSVAIYFVLALILPHSWLAVRSANALLGGGDQAVCALINYRMSIDTCRTELAGKQMQVTFGPRSPAPAHRR